MKREYKIGVSYSPSSHCSKAVQANPCDITFALSSKAVQANPCDITFALSAKCGMRVFFALKSVPAFSSLKSLGTYFSSSLRHLSVELCKCRRTSELAKDVLSISKILVQESCLVLLYLSG